MPIENNYEPEEIKPSVDQKTEIGEKNDWTLQYLQALIEKEKLMSTVETQTEEKTPEETVTEIVKQNETEFGKLTTAEIKDIIKCFQDAADGKTNQIGLVDISKGEIHRREQDTKNLLKTVLPEINKIIGQYKTTYWTSISGIEDHKVARIFINPKKEETVS